MDLSWLKVPQWKQHNNLVHGFLGRRGGNSRELYGGLNLSFQVGDDPKAVKDNFCDVKKAVGLPNLRIVTMQQMHGDRIIEVSDKKLKEAEAADGMVTGVGGVFLSVLTADCVPVLFSVPSRNLAAVVHAGWKGTLAGLSLKMIRYLKHRYGVEPTSMEVALGPSIGRCCYEIRTDVSTPLVERWGTLARQSLEVRDGREFLDLRSLNRSLVQEGGIPEEQIFVVGSCTSCTQDFFSYRRDGNQTGRQISFIGWLEKKFDT